MGYIHQMLMGFVEILKKTYKIFSTNGKLIPFITLLYLLIESILFLINFFSIKPLVIQLARKLIMSFLLVGNPTPNTSDFTKLVTFLKDDVRKVAGLELIFLLASSFISFFFAVAAILASSATFGGKKLYFKDLLSRRVWKPWKRAFVTVFYVTLLELGYSFMASSFIMLPLVLILGVDLAKSSYYIIMFMVASIFYCYLSIVWNLALAVSVMEEKYCGIEALGKAGQLVKGLKLQGFLMNLVFGILYCVAFQVIRTMNGKQSEAVTISIALFFIDFICLVKMFMLIAYTVLYHECKKSHGEEIEMQESIEYTEVPASKPLIISADLP